MATEETNPSGGGGDTGGDYFAVHNRPAHADDDDTKADDAQEVAARAADAALLAEAKGGAKFTQMELGCQEMALICEEIDLLSRLPTEAGQEWIAIPGLVGALLISVGHEDLGELEDAMGMPVAAFISRLPGYEVRKNPDTGHDELKRITEKQVVQGAFPGQPFKMIINCKKNADLQRVLRKAPNAQWGIPAMEFVSGASDNYVTNTIWNHISTAIFNLGMYANQLGEGSVTRERITETITQLEDLRDLTEPFVMHVDDPSGLTVIKPHDDGINMFWEGNERDVLTRNTAEVSDAIRQEHETAILRAQVVAEAQDAAAPGDVGADELLQDDID